MTILGQLVYRGFWRRFYDPSRDPGWSDRSRGKWIRVRGWEMRRVKLYKVRGWGMFLETAIRVRGLLNSVGIFPIFEPWSKFKGDVCEFDQGSRIGHAFGEFDQGSRIVIICWKCDQGSNPGRRLLERPIFEPWSIRLIKKWKRNLKIQPQI